jgi:hypothetical protein
MAFQRGTLAFADDEVEITMSLWWWSGWRELIALLDLRAERDGILVDDGTEKWLAARLGRPRDPSRIGSDPTGRWSAPRIGFPDGLARLPIRSTMPRAARWGLIVAWVAAAFPLVGTISENSPDTYPVWVDLLGFFTVVVATISVIGLAFGIRDCVHVTFLAACAGTLLGVIDAAFAPSIWLAETAVFLVMALLSALVLAWSNIPRSPPHSERI